MYAIVDIQGQQFKAEAGKKLYVHRLAAEQGASVEFDKVLLLDNDGTVSWRSYRRGRKSCMRSTFSPERRTHNRFQEKKKKRISQTQRTPSMLYTSVN